jgi:hypothetical protein
MGGSPILRRDEATAARLPPLTSPADISDIYGYSEVVAITLALNSQKSLRNRMAGG